MEATKYPQYFSILLSDDDMGAWENLLETSLKRSRRVASDKYVGKKGTLIIAIKHTNGDWEEVYKKTNFDRTANFNRTAK
jgi:hypothetical protein